MKNGKMSIRKIDGGYSIFAQLKCEVQFPKAENLNPELWNRGTTLIGCEIITSWNFKQGDKISVHVFPGMITSERIDMLEMYPQDFKNTHWAEAKKSYYSRVYYEGFYTELCAELAESDMLNSLLAQITGKPSNIRKKSQNLGDLIRNSNYALS